MSYKDETIALNQRILFSFSQCIMVDRYKDGISGYRVPIELKTRGARSSSIYLHETSTPRTKNTKTYTTIHDVTEIDTGTYNIIVSYLFRCINNIHARKIRGDFSVKGKPCFDRCPIKLPIL